MVSSTRLLCLYIPCFPWAAYVRANPERRSEPVAMVSGTTPQARVASISPSAEAAGLFVGLSIPQAKAIAPHVAFRARDAEAEKGCQRALIEVAEAFSPRVEDGGDGIVYLDTYQDSHEQFLADNAVRRARKLDLFVRAGAASSKLVARIAAQRARDVIVVEAGHERKFLDALPIEQLPLSLALSNLFEKWGVRTIGDFAKLSERDVLVRLGKEGGQLHKQARGGDAEPLVPRPHTLTYVEGVELEWEIGEMEPFLIALRGLLERLLARLNLQALACRRLEIFMRIEPQGHEQRALDLPAPTRDSAVLLTLIRAELERRPLTGPVSMIRVSVEPERPRAQQLSLFGPPALSNDALNTATARLVAMLGADRVGSPRAVDGPCPERFALQPFRPPTEKLFFDEKKIPSSRTLAEVRVFRPAVPIDVLVNGSPQRPVRVRTKHADRYRIEGTVERAAGPWLIEDAWWTETLERRAYWDVALSDRSLYRIYHDSVRNAWFVDGMYD